VSRFSAKWALVRVTKFGKFSPFGRLCSWGSFLKVTEVAEKFVLLLSTEEVTIWEKLCLGYILGDVVTNSSNHPNVGLTALASR
jgi:hypothetical protein